MINNRPTQNGLSNIFRRDVKDVYVTVRDNNVDQALRVLKKKMQREGVFREMKNRRSFEKPSERRARDCRVNPSGAQVNAQTFGTRRRLDHSNLIRPYNMKTAKQLAVFSYVLTPFDPPYYLAESAVLACIVSTDQRKQECLYTV